jgi:hypothetical protein
MGDPVTRNFEPTVPERTRSALAGAPSLTICTDRYREVLLGLHSLDDRARVVLHLPHDSRIAADLGRTPDDALRAVLEFTDLAPISVRCRVRAQVTVTGRLSVVQSPAAAETMTARLEPDMVRFKAGGEDVPVHLEELSSAETDPLTEHESGLLLHLADAHADLVAQLTHLIEPRLMNCVVGVQPLAMDRFGITLRLEYTGRHHDIRVPFRTRLTDVAQVGAQFRALLAEASLRAQHRCLHGR